MTTFEYKLIDVPPQVAAGDLRLNAPGEFAPTLSGQINLASGAGWEFLRLETIELERRSWWFLRRNERREVMVFRRLQAPRPVPAAGTLPVRPRRIRAADAGCRARPEAARLAI